MSSRGERGYTLSREDLTRVNRAVLFVERFAREGVNVTPLPGFRPGNTSEPILWPVEVTALAPGDGPPDLLVGRLWLPDPSSLPPWRSEACWVREVPGFALAVGDAGMAKCVGWEAATGPYDALPVYTILCCGSGIDGFFARLTSGSGVGPWTAQPLAIQEAAWIDDGATVFPACAKPWRDDGTVPNPQVGDHVWVKRSEVTPTEYEFISHPNFNCGFVHNPADDSWAVNVEQLAGDGLTFSEGGEGCDQLDVDVGCGLDIDGDGKLVVDLGQLAGSGLSALEEIAGCNRLSVNVGCGLEIAANVVRVKADDLAGAGLITDGDCGLRVNVGCGLFIESDVVKVDNVTLAGSGLGVEGACALKVNVGCGLEVQADAVQVDTEIDSTQTLTVQVDSQLTIEGSSVCLTKTLRVVTNHYNACGMLIYQSFGTPYTETGGCVDVCEPCDAVQTECCEETVPATVTVTFAGGPCGGAYEMAWDGTAWRGLIGSGPSAKSIDLTCQGGTWYFQINLDAYGTTSESCDPFELVFDVSGAGGACEATTATVTA